MQDLNNFKMNGMKKSTWVTPKGKKMGLITFGKKRDIILPLEDYEWENIVNIELEKDDIDAGDLYVWLKNDYQTNQRILQYKKLSKYLYLDSKKSFWLDYSLIDSMNKKRENSADISVRGKILYTKKNAGFFLLLLGNWYFLPKGESLTYYKPGIWESNYGAVVSRVGLYTEGVSNFVFSNFLENLDFKTSVEKVSILHKILGNLLAHELSYIFYKGSRRNKRAQGVRRRALMCYSYYLHILTPVVKDMQRLERIAKKENIDVERILEKGLKWQKKSKEINEELLLISRKALESAKTKEDFNYYWVYTSLLELVCKEGNFKPFKLDRIGGVEVKFSKADKRRLTSVSRRSLGL